MFCYRTKMSNSGYYPKIEGKVKFENGLNESNGRFYWNAVANDTNPSHQVGKRPLSIKCYHKNEFPCLWSVF